MGGAFRRLIVAAIVGVAAAAAVGASDPAARRSLVVHQTVETDLMAAAERVRVDARVAGDAVVAGAEVVLVGPVDGYVMAAGRSVRVFGSTSNDAWLAGETVQLDGPVGDSVRLAGRDVSIGPDATVGGDAMLAGQVVIVDGRVERDVRIGAAEARLAGEVGGSVEVHAGEVSVLPGAVVEGDLVVHSPQPPEIAPEARVLGRIVHEEVEDTGFTAPPWPLRWLYALAALLVLGFAVLAVAPLWTGRVSGTLRHRPGWSMLAGLVVLVLVPLVAVLLLVTLIGIPLAVVLMSLWMALLLLSGVGVAYLVGGWLLARSGRPESSPWARMALGALIVSLAVSLPAIGWLLALAVLLAGVGAIALERSEARWRPVSDTA